MTITFYTKEVYGKQLIYLANKAETRHWHAITGKKTITGDDMTHLNLLTGATFIRVFEAES